MFPLFFFGAVFGYAICLVQAQTWTKVAPVPAGPSPGFRGHSAVLFNQTILIFGGYFVGERFDDLWSFSIEAGTWMRETFNNTPSARSAHSAVLDSNLSLWIFGGSLGTTGPYASGVWVTNELYYLDTQAQTWLTVDAADAPNARAGHSAIVDFEDRIWIFGGQGGLDASYSALDDLYCFNIKASSWTLVAGSGTKPSPRFVHTATLVLRNLSPLMWVFGGTDSSSYFNDLYYFDLQALSWTPVNAGGNVPAGRSEHSAAFDYQQGLWIFGGWGVGGYDDLYYLDLEAETWTKINVSPISSYGRYGHSAVVDPLLRMWIYGYGGDSYADDWYYLDLQTTTSTTATFTTATFTTSTSTSISRTSSTSSSVTSTSSTSSFTTSSSRTTATTSTTSTQSRSSTAIVTSVTTTVTDFWDSVLLTERLSACGSVPLLTSPVAQVDIETRDEWEAEVEISPCLDAKPVLLRWEYRCVEVGSTCEWQALESILVDLDLRASVVRLQKFSFQADTRHEIRVSASYEDTFGANTSLVFPLHVLPKRRPVAIVSGPHVVSQSCRFTLSARNSRDVWTASSTAEDFLYAWRLTATEGLQDVSHLLTAQQRGSVDLEIGASTFPLGRYIVRMQLWRRAETINAAGETDFQLFVGVQAMPVVSIESSWLPGDRVSTEADATNITASIGLSAPDCLVENLTSWSWRWLLLEDRTQDVIADFGATSDGLTLVMSTASFHNFAMKSGEQYSYGVAGIPASFTSYGFADLFGLGLTLSKSHRFTADAPPGGGSVEARPCTVASIASPIIYRTFGWQDEDPDGLEYAFFRFSAALLPSTSAENCEADRIAAPEIEWEDVTSPRYFRALGGFMLRAWAKSPLLETLMPSGKFYILVRARDSVAGKGETQWMVGVTIGTTSMDATEMNSLLQANVVTGDADRIFTSVEAILSMGGTAGNGEAGMATQQADMLGALQVASNAMEPTAESMETLATIVGDVVSLAPVNNETGSAAVSMLQRILTLGDGTSSFNDRRVATSMFNAIGVINERTPEPLRGGTGGSFQSRVEDLAMSLGDAVMSNMENESFASLTNPQMQLEVSRSKRMISGGACDSCEMEHIQKGRLHMETGTVMAGSRRLQGGAGADTVTVTAKLLVWKDFTVGQLDRRKGFNSIIPDRVDAIIAEIGQECVGSQPLVHRLSTRHMWPSDPPPMTRTICVQFNDTDAVWFEAITEIYGKQMHVDCFSTPICGTGVQRTTSAVIHAPDVWGNLANGVFVLWICLMILCVCITVGVTVILSVYKFETHVKHVAAANDGGPRRRRSHEEGPKAHAWSVVPAQIPGRMEEISSESESEELLDVPKPRVPSSALLPSPMASRRPSLASRQLSMGSRRPSLSSRQLSFAQEARGSRNMSADFLGPLDSAPVSEVRGGADLTPHSANASALGEPMIQDVPSLHPSIPSEEVMNARSTAKEAWG